MRIRFLFCLSILMGLLPSTAQALQDDPALTLRLHRDFGYGGLDQSIQGRFSLYVNDLDWRRVDFYIDEQWMGSALSPPYRLQFETDDYPSGRHTLYATGITSKGTSLRSNQITTNFLTTEEARRATLGLVVPILVVSFGLTGVAALVPLLLSRGSRRRPIGEYGLAGGAVCPRCSFSYSRHMLAPNLLLGKLERCPHCGKWAIVPRATGDALHAAEARLRTDRQDGIMPNEESAEERLRHQLEESRFED